MNKIFLLAVSACLVFASSAAAIDVDNPPQGVFTDEWYALMLNGSKSGHMHVKMERLTKEGQELIRSSSDLTLTVRRAKLAISLEMNTSSDETLDGKPLSFRNTMQMGKIPTTTLGRIKDGKVTLITRQFGINTERRTFDLPAGAIMSWGTYREQIRRGLKAGLRYELPIYEPSVAPERLTKTTVEVFDKERVDVFGRSVEAWKTRQTVEIGQAPGNVTRVPTTSWITDEGELVQLKMMLPGLEVGFDVLACPKAVALADDDPAELMIDTLISVDKLDQDASSTTYELTWRGEDVESMPRPPETGMQQVRSVERGRSVIHLTRWSARRRDATASRPAPLSQAEQALYLQASAELNYKDKAVADLLNKARGKATQPWEVVCNLTDFVHGYVKEKDLSVGFATAGEVARSRQGDCTEHGVLLAALCRAAGVPSRIVTGIVYAPRFGGKSNVMVGHLWTQVYVENQWVDIDGALGQTDVDTTHIALGLAAAGDGGLGDLATSAWLSMPKLKVKRVGSGQ